MANLRVNKITGTEVFETTGSVQFDGSGDVLTVPNNADFRLGSGDFTLECFMYYVGPLSSSRTLFGLFENSSARRSYQLEVRSTGVLRFEWWADGSTTNAIDSPASSISSSQWSHIAVVRNGSVITVYLNGSSVATSVVGTSSFFDNTVDSFRIGALNAAVDQSFSGHISNVRVIKGQALYTKNFTPPTRELTVIPNTVLLACQSTTRANEERTGKTITVNGNAVANELTPGLLTDRVKSGGSSSISGSVEFDGNDYLLESTGADGFNGGLGDWTVEAWMYCTDASQSDTLLNGLTSSTDRFYIQFIGQTLYVGDFIINNIAIGGVKQVNSWFHIAVTKSSSTYRAFINGILIGSSTSALANSPLTSLQIGHRASQNYYTKGFISNLRILKGTALYTQNFIPPTRELKNLPGTVLLCCQNSKSATQEATGKTITVNGNATARYFTPSVGFDGFVNFDGVTKIKSPNYFYLPTGTTEDRGRGRGVFGGGYVAPTVVNTIDYISISNTGNAIDFGDMITPSSNSSALGSSTRGVVGGISTPTTVNTIEYITFASTSNSFDFGDLTVARWGTSTASNTTRGIFYSGYVAPANINVIDYITIASIGNATDFGDAITAGRSGDGCSSPIRGIFASGVSPSANTIEYITISSTGNSQDFGDLTVGRIASAASSSSTRAIFAGGYVGPAGQLTNTIDYITISSTGNAQDFGDLTRINWSLKGLSNSIRGIIGGGYVAPVYNNNIDYVTISSTGNSQDFGDMTSSRGSYSACSDSHGGLG